MGIDIEMIERWTVPDRRLFGDDEIAYCDDRAEPAEAFAGTWCAKEAVVKSVYAHTPLLTRDVIVARLPSGAPIAAIPSGIAVRVQLSISHQGGVAVAVAVAVATP